MPEPPTRKQIEELDGCIAVAIQVEIERREEVRLQEKKELDKKHFTEGDQRLLDTITRYLPEQQAELEWRKTQVLMHGQPHG